MMQIQTKIFQLTIKDFFTKGSSRSIIAKKNIVASMLIKGGSILISLLLVPLTLGYLNSYEYGVWLTLSSVLMWINYFDIGIGNGLRNKLAEAIAVGNKELGRIYVSTTFFILFFLMLFIYIIFLVVQHWLDWNQLLNAPSNLTGNLNSLVYIVFAFYCLSFVMKSIGNIFMAMQLSAMNDLLNFLSNLLSLIFIVILMKTTKGDLNQVAIYFSLSPVIIYLLAYPIVFYKKFSYLRPKISAIKLKYTKDLIGLGVKFFVIQIAYLVIFTTSNILISRLFGPKEVTPYNIAFKYFSVITMVFSILISPMWTAITDAYTKNDINWIKSSMHKMKIMWLFLFVITILMIIISNFLYTLWVGKNIKIPLTLSVLTGLYVTISNFTNIFAYFVNGIGKVRIQLYCSLFSGIIYIPLAILLSKSLGVQGIMASMCIVLLLSAIFLPIQYNKIITNKASGIWLK